ncbi:MAG: NADH-quinone oxidoreductase subunit NuoH [Gemmatimonadales bacterium]
MTPELKGFLLVSIVKLLVVFTFILVGVALLTLLERKVSAWMQNRLGPNRVGYGGLLQPAADGLKNITKEETNPPFANRVLFNLAPAMAFIPAMTLSAVIPWAAPLPLHFDFTLGALGRFTFSGVTPMVVADLPVGFLFILAVSSLGVYGIALAGWSSNSKYSLMGGLRASAQMVSYEVGMGLSLIPVLLLTGNVSFSTIIAEQQQGLWFCLPLMVGAFLFTVTGFAETNRVPFDLPEAESELVAGYHTEYSAMKFSMFFIAEYAGMVTISAMVATLFLGGWDIPFITWDQTPGVAQTIATAVVFFLKVFFFIFVFMWVRWTLPRFRFDQLMSLGWKVLIPLALAYVMVMATALYVGQQLLGLTRPLYLHGFLAGVNLVLAVLVFFVLDRGSVIAGTGEQMRRQRLESAGRSRLNEAALPAAPGR